jgi:Methyltransferase FkbM domain
MVWPFYFPTCPLLFLTGVSLGHTFIDVLKIDVEGAEFNTLTTFLKGHWQTNAFGDVVLPIGQLQLELHAWDDYANFGFFHDWWVSLEAAGLRPFWTEPNLVYVNYVTGGKPHLAEVGD